MYPGRCWRRPRDERARDERSVDELELEPELRRVGREVLGVVAGPGEGADELVPHPLEREVQLRAPVRGSALRVEAVIDGIGGDRVEADRALPRIADAEITVVDAVRRRREELVGPALELVQRPDGRREALHAVALE